MGFEVGQAVLAYIDFDVTEPWFDLDELKNRFSGYASLHAVAVRKAAVEKEPEVCMVFQKKTEENLLDLPLAARIWSKRMWNQPGNMKGRPGVEKKEWQKHIEREEKIDANFKVWLEKRKVEPKEAEEQQKTDPKFCYETEKEGIIRLSDEGYDRYQGLISK